MSTDGRTEYEEVVTAASLYYDARSELSMLHLLSAERAAEVLTESRATLERALTILGEDEVTGRVIILYELIDTCHLMQEYSAAERYAVQLAEESDTRVVVTNPGYRTRVTGSPPKRAKEQR